MLGKEGDDWDHLTGRGDLLLPNLGLALPLYPGDVVFFQPALLPHAVNPLNPDEVARRTVITMFNCEPLDYLEEHCATLEDSSDATPAISDEMTRYLRPASHPASSLPYQSDEP